MKQHKELKYLNYDTVSLKIFMIKFKKLYLNLNFILSCPSSLVENSLALLISLNNLYSKEKRISILYLFVYIYLVSGQPLIYIKVALPLNT